MSPRPVPGHSSRPPDHYSYTVYADPAMAEGFEEVRFGGPVGEWVAETQARVLKAFLEPLAGRAVVDVGTGSGRAALILAGGGAIVTGVDASAEMLRVARERAASRELAIQFDQADAHALPFGDRSFDAAVCLRVLMHAPHWRRCLGELCRVARTRIVFDYPALRSAAVLQALGRRLAAAAGARVEAYRVLSDRAVRDVLRRHGFVVRDVHRQCVLPIALHKRLGSRERSARIEAALASAGLLRAFGSPVTVVADRCASS